MLSESIDNISKLHSEGDSLKVPPLASGLAGRGRQRKETRDESKGRQTVLSIYSADRHFESTSDARIYLRCGAMVEAQHTRNVPKLDRRIPYVKPRDFGTIQ